MLDAYLYILLLETVGVHPDNSLISPHTLVNTNEVAVYEYDIRVYFHSANWSILVYLLTYFLKGDLIKY